MALHILMIRCPDCRTIYTVRKPNSSLLIPRIVAEIQCPTCYPEALLKVCGGCRLPLSIVRRKKYGSSGFHSQICFTCYQRMRRARALQSPASA